MGQMVALKKKARILIPECCVLIGVPDQCGYLEPGEVFVQIRPDSFSKKDVASDSELAKNKTYKNFKEMKEKGQEKIIEGDILVTKNPCSHPGDI